jgi:4-hydroxybenzoyl-CoA thioesterase
MKFARDIVVRFEHCDAAGLMFYPRFFGLVNEMVEDWFAALGYSFKAMHVEAKKGVPTVKLDAQFGRPARMGDHMTQTLHVAAIGSASCTLKHEASVDGAPVAQFEQVIVYVDLNGLGPEAWPEPLRKAMAQYEEPA